MHIPDQDSFEALPVEVKQYIELARLTDTTLVYFTLPLPPSANRYWRRGGANTYKSAEANEFIEVAKVTARAAMQEAGLDLFLGDLNGFIYVYRDNAGRDLNNCTKVLYDALQDVVYIDDKQIASERHIRDYDKDNPRAIVVISVTIGNDYLKLSRGKKKVRPI